MRSRLFLGGPAHRETWMKLGQMRELQLQILPSRGLYPPKLAVALAFRVEEGPNLREGYRLRFRREGSPSQSQRGLFTVYL